MFDALLDDRARLRLFRSTTAATMPPVPTVSFRQHQPARISCLQPASADQQSQQQ